MKDLERRREKERGTREEVEGGDGGEEGEKNEGGNGKNERRCTAEASRINTK